MRTKHLCCVGESFFFGGGDSGGLFDVFVVDSFFGAPVDREKIYVFFFQEMGSHLRICLPFSSLKTREH